MSIRFIGSVLFVAECMSSQDLYKHIHKEQLHDESKSNSILDTTDETMEPPLAPTAEPTGEPILFPTQSPDLESEIERELGLETKQCPHPFDAEFEGTEQVICNMAI